ncbi:GFA family protein [Flagellatimonas centrodinii]|uniref:GFA family protein n=1 Tax=Flagellatimonas centrodinii TaxID=2806210 RepID=UPI001FF0790A|nr:GFA family protein [Flagellatimonas centrodinii]ULQ46152.1 GFA family protein [Flagellatimonas centrodinii]
MAHDHGTCLCGAVQFEIHGQFEGFFLCHCRRCRKGSGSAHAANLFSPSGRVHWLTGADRVVQFTVPGTRHVRAFCSACGAPLPRAEAGGGVVVPAGSLDSTPSITPQAHIFSGHRAPWDDALETLPRFESLPGQG